MNLAVVGQAILLAGAAIFAYLWVLNKLAPSPSRSRQRAKYGLNQEYSATDDQSRSDERTTDVIFVHGLGADPTKTWRSGDVCWITDLFPKDLEEKGIQSSVRLFTFNYDSFWVRDANSTRLADTARSLGHELLGDKLRGHGLVLVGHSYGGLVIKQALVDFLELKNRVKGVLFLGTPHSGSPYSRFGLLAARLLTPLDADVEIVRLLVAGNHDLKDLDDRFRDKFETTKRLYYREKKKMRRYLLGFIPWIREFVVPEHSATAGAHFSQIFSLDADHRGLNRFRDREDSNYRSIVSELLKILSSSHVPSKEPSLQGHWLVPLERNKNFVGRKPFLERLVEQIHPSKDEKYCQKTAIIGLGGVGKTQIAMEAAFLIREVDPGCSVFWVPAVDATSFEKAYRAIGQELRIDGIEDDKADVTSLVKTALSQDSVGRWLLIVDNVDDLDLTFGKEQTGNSISRTALARHLPFGRNGSILFTTRNSKVAVKLEAQKYTVESMEADEAHELLMTHLDRHLVGDDESVRQIISELANLPLAIKQAAAYMKENQISTAEYLDIYRTSDDEMIHLLSKEFEDLGRYDTIKNPIATTWIISFHRILNSDPLAAHYLRFMSCLAEQDIPLSLLPSEGKGEGKAKRKEAIGTLKAYSFITSREADSYDIHQLVLLSVREWLKIRKEWKLCVKEVFQRFARVFPSPKHENRDIWTRYLPHARRVLQFVKDADDEEAERDLLSNVGQSFSVLGKYNEAERMHRQALELREKVLGKEHPDTLTSMNSLANTLNNSQGKYNEAEQMHRQALKLREKVLGKEHPDTLASIHNLANILDRQGKYSKAEQMYRQVLELQGKVLDKEHPDTLMCINNLANALYSQGKYNEAEQMHWQALKLREKVLGKEHPDTLASINNLANILDSQGRYDQAEQMHRQALELQGKVLGKEHPNTLVGMNNLANTFYSQSKYNEAEQMYRQALELREKVLGKEHPDTLASINNLAVLLKHQSKYNEAEQMYWQVLELQGKTLSKEHPNALTSMSNLANILNRQGKHNEAEQMHRQALELREKVLGKEHPDTLRSISNLASTFYRQRKYSKAKQMHQQALELQKKVLGEEHPDTLVSMGNLAGTLKSLGKHDEARDLMEEYKPMS